jgi:hypothetical protein
MSPVTVIIPFPDAPPAATAAQYETDINRDNTTAYIATDPTDIIFTPRVKVSDGHGGQVWSTPGALQAQRVRIITSATLNIERRTEDGRMVNPDVLLLLEWDAVVENGYRFTYDGNNWEVVFVNDDLNYEKQAEVVRLD